MINNNHLGGHNSYTNIDYITLNYLIDKYNIKNMVDVGCRTGKMVKYAISKGVNAIGIDGDPNLDIYSDPVFKKHDYTISPYFLSNIYDLCWTVEFLEHVEEKYLSNIFITINSCRVVCCTHAVPGQIGYHHVNCQLSEYWLNIFRKNGFKISLIETFKIRKYSKMKYMKQTGLIFLNRNYRTS